MSAVGDLTRSRSRSAEVPDSDDERVGGRQHAALALALDSPRPTKRVRVDSPGPQMAAFPPSQELRSFLDGLDPAELDQPPSSDPAPARPVTLNGHPPELAKAARRLTTEQPKWVGESDRAADDSGVFLVTDAGPVRVDSDDPDLATGDEVMLTDADEEVIIEVQAAPLSDAAEFEFDGDDIWDGYDADTPPPDEMSLTQHVETARERSPDPDLEREKEYGGRWDAFRSLVDPNAPLAFFNAGGKKVAMSEEALQRAKALLEADDDAVPHLPAPATAFNAPRPSTSVAFATHSTPSSRPPSRASSERIKPIKSHLNEPVHRTSSPHQLPPATVRPSFGGFTSGSGAPVAGPSAESIARVNGRLDGPPLAFGGFTSGSGAPGAAPSASAIVRANKRLDAPPPAFGGFTSGSGAPVAGPSAASLARTLATLDAPLGSRSSQASSDRDVFAGSPASGSAKGKGKVTFELAGSAHASSEADQLPPTDSPIASRVLPRGPSSPPAPPSDPPIVTLRAQIADRTASTSKPALGTPRPKPLRVGAPLPFNSPMLSSRKPPMASTTIGSPNLSTSATPLKAAPGLRRLNLAMTPRPRVAHVHKFVTPFKGGVRPPGLAPTGLLPSAIKATPQSTPGKGKATEVAPTTGSFVPVFNLTPKGPRQGLAEAGFRPQTHFYEHLVSEGLAEEAVAMDSGSAASFVFECGRGEVEAMAALSAAGCSLITLPWIKNHWSLVVWKLASLARTRPDVRSTYWHWQAAVDQLKYRYEREVNRAQRSCVKRIQEQDSSAAHPLVLCVSQIRWGDSPEAPVGADQPLVIVGLELTDGWYRIRANIDQTLRSACERGKVVVGAKLAISGAKIESSRDGTDVLDALSKSSINISGNSTNLAPWDAKLGWVRHPFVASLGKLTSAGGTAPLLDVFVERIFPCGYLDMSRNGARETWNAEEELVKAEEWASGRAKAEARLAEEVEKTKGDWDDVIELLQDAAHKVGVPTGSPDPDSMEEEPDEILDRLEGASNKAAIINKLSARQVASTLQLAAENSIRDKQQAISEIEQDLATSFPPRNVRVFRALRIRDAQEGETPSSRTALLTVWDADGFADDFFVEGQRYLVSNISPKGNWQRKAPELALATRRDSKWERVAE